MTAQLVRLDDYRPPQVGIAELFLNAWLRVWQSVALLAAIPLLYMRGKR